MPHEQLGEFALIARLTAALPTRADVRLGVGDDAALLLPRPGYDLVATCDAQVQGRHFLLEVASAREIGHKALAVNLSDIAAMGAEPLWALVSLLVPAGIETALLEGIYQGMGALATRFGVAIVGGNVSGTDGPLALDVTLLGQCPAGRALRRDGGQPGDTLLVTGPLGAAAAGLLAHVRRPGAAPVAPDVLEEARRALVAPEPPVAAGLALATCPGVAALMDCSDGLAADLAHLAARSQTGAEVDAEALPIAAAAATIAQAYGADARELALHGGEDYVLLCAVRPEAVSAVTEALAGVGCRATAIGRLTEPSLGLQLREAGGGTRPLPPLGWDALASAH